MSAKPHKGYIKNWFRRPCAEGLGYVIVGEAVNHPQFGNETIHTSWVEKHDEAAGEVETRNSRYTLIGAGFDARSLSP